MADRLVLLGTKGGPALRPGGPWPTSSLLEIGGRTIVVDCGLGVTRALTEAGMGLKALDLVFITHLHSDHVLELGPLLHTAWTAGLASTVRVYGPAGTDHYWQRFLQSMEFDIEIRIGDEGRPDLRDLVVVEEFSEGPVMEAGGLEQFQQKCAAVLRPELRENKEIEHFRDSEKSGNTLSVNALRVDHPPVTECFALRFDSGDASVVFSADTAAFPPLAAFARGASILVHEAMLEKGIDRLVARTGNGARLKDHLLASHTLAADAGRIAADAGVGRLVIHHLIPADDPDIGESHWIDAVRTTWSGPLTIGRDGLVLDLPAKGG